jgi:hypothetical protein
MKIFFMLLIFSLSSALGDGNVGMVKSITGKVKIKRQNRMILAKRGTTLKNGDVIITQDKSSVGIIFDDGSRLSLGAKSIFNLNRFIFNPSKNRYDVDLKLIKGKALFNSGKVGKLAPKAVKFKIPEGIIGIRGTEFLVEVK